MNARRSDPGIVLLMVLAILALLSVLGVVMVSMTQLERSISKNYLARTRAMLAAESGVEYAIKQIDNFEGGVMTSTEREAMEYVGDASDMEKATRASFQKPEVADRPISGMVSDSYDDDSEYFILRVVDESGKINLNDTDGQWNVDTDPNWDAMDDPERVAAPYRLREIVVELGDALFATDYGPGIGSLMAIALLDPSSPNSRAHQPQQRFSGWEGVKSALTGVLNAADIEEFRNHATLWSWQDPDTIRPTFQLSISTPPGFESIPDYADRDVFLYSDWQTKGFALEPRCPIHLNAASPEVLTALLKPLRGWYLREGPGEHLSAWHYGTWYVASRRQLHNMTSSIQYFWKDCKSDHLLNKDISYPTGTETTHETCFGQAMQTTSFQSIHGGLFARELANRIWSEIHTNKNPIETWEEFDLVLDGIIADLLPDDDPLWLNDVFWSDWRPGPAGYPYVDIRNHFGSYSYLVNGVDRPYWAAYGRRVIRDLITAMFNPNSRIQDFNLDHHLHRHCDKAHLISYTAELSLEPTGVFAVDSVGIVRSPDGVVVSKQKISSVISMFSLFRVTTQQDFMEGLMDGSGAGRPIQDFSTPPALADDTDWNCTVTSYPEPLHEDGGDAILSSRFDGMLQLSTYTLPRNRVRFLHRFSGTLNANTPSGLSGPVHGDASALFVYKSDLTYEYKFGFGVEEAPILYGGWTPRNLPTAGLLTRDLSSLQPETTPGCLLPDGALSDAGRSLIFPAEFFGNANSNGLKGYLAFWAKPNFDVPNSTRIRRLFSMMGEYYGNSYHLNRTLAVPREFSLTYFAHWGNNFRELRGYSDAFVTGGSGNDDSTWIPPATLAFGWGWSKKAPLVTARVLAGVVTPTAATTLPNQKAGESQRHHTYHFDAHQWSHFSLLWNQLDNSGVASNTVGLYVNGKNPQIKDGVSLAQVESSVAPQDPVNLHFHPIPDGSLNPVYVRLGETAHHSGINYVADCTFDEIVSGEAQAYDVALETEYFDIGRYYHSETGRDAAVYLSPAYAMKKLMADFNRERVTVRSVSWTGYWPTHNRRYNLKTATEENPKLLPVDVQSGVSTYRDDPVYGALDPFSVSVGAIRQDGTSVWCDDADGDGALYEDLADSMTYAGGSKPAARLTLEANDRLAFRVYFNVPPGSVLYESPALDDITVCLAGNRPQVLFWNIVSSQ